MTRRTFVDPTQVGLPLRFDELAAAAIPRSRIRAADVTHPHYGVHVVGAAAADLRDRCEALAPVLKPGEAFSHATAARLLGAPLPRTHQEDSRLHVTSVGRDDRMRRPGIVGHRAASLPVTMHLGLTIVEPAHTWVQLATVLSHDDLVAVGDYLVTPKRRGTHRQPPLTTIDAVHAAIPARSRGAARARRALADVRIGSESRMETYLRLMLIRAGLPEPLLNPAIRIGDDTLHPDLLYPQWRVALEYEGDHHRTDPKQWRHDIWRGEVFASAGWRVIRVTSDDILKQREAFLARVCRELAQRARELS